jgi:Rad3-related DNA helicase
VPGGEATAGVRGAGALVVAPGGRGPLLRRQGDAWHLDAALLWSLLDPLAPRPDPPDTDPVRVLRRVWARLGWWRTLPRAERVAVGGLLDRAVRGGGAVAAGLDRVATAGDPFGAAAPGATAAPPAGELPAPDPAEVARFFDDPAGLPRLYGNRYASRPGQADLAAAVARALASGHALLAEAGTGTGKTLAYLVPLLAHLEQDGQHRAVVSTYSRALQAQILDGDLPRLTRGGESVLARRLMGRRNYLCLRQRRAYLTRPLEEPREALKTAALRLWLLATGEGLRDELVRHPLLAEDLRPLFASAQPCTPECWEGDGCFVVRARRRAREAQLVVVNHALLLSDQDADGALIGPYDLAVVDEAHRLPGAALEARSVRLDHGRLLDLEEVLGAVRPAGQVPETATLLAARLRELPHGDPAAVAAEELGRAANRALRAYGSWWRACGSALAPGGRAAPGQRLRIAEKEVAFAPVAAATGEVLETLAVAVTAGASFLQQGEQLPELPPAAADLHLRCGQAVQLLRLLERDVRFVVQDPSDRWVTWLDPAPRGVLRALGATPLEPGPLLRELWQGAGLAPVTTSATLSVAGDFGFMIGELGLGGRRPPTATELVPSPFAWPERTVALAAEDLPDPDRPEFATAITEILADLRRTVPRQTLALFTSYRLLQEVAAGLREEAAEPDLFGGEEGALLVQTPQAAPAELRDRFARSRRAMLLGTSTFWEGVDFPGESLEIVVVTKLPFLVPSDPWVQARCDHIRQAGDDPFADFMVRDAVLRLRQGVGRLLRRPEDRGVVLLLDNRLITRRYGATFRSALPAPVRWLPRRAELAAAARAFLDRD